MSNASERSPLFDVLLEVTAFESAVLHAFGSEAALHRRNPEVHVFGYHDGGKHMLDPAKAPNLVLIGTTSFLNDIVVAIEAFLKACQEDNVLRARVEARLPKILQSFPMNL